MPTVLKDLWRDKPLLIAVIVGVVGIIYILYRNSHANVVAPSSATSGAAGQATTGGGTYVEGTTSIYAPTTINSAPPSGTTPSWPAGPPAPLPPDSHHWIYTTQAGDTLNSLTAKFGWTPDKQKGGGPVFTYGYLNNGAIFNAVGISPNQPNQLIPAGIQINA